MPIQGFLPDNLARHKSTTDEQFIDSRSLMSAPTLRNIAGGRAGGRAGRQADRQTDRQTNRRAGRRAGEEEKELNSGCGFTLRIKTIRCDEKKNGGKGVLERGQKWGKRSA